VTDCTLADYQGRWFSVVVATGRVAHFLGEGRVALEEVAEIEDNGSRLTRYLGEVSFDERLFEITGYTSTLPDARQLSEALLSGEVSYLVPKPPGQTPAWRLRTPVRELLDAPPSSPCCFCPCEECSGVVTHPNLHHYSHELAEPAGARICDVCWYYPPCGMSEDCARFEIFGWCEHRPKLKEGSTWQTYASLSAERFCQ